MKEILLTSEDFVKSMTNISDNLAGKYVLPAIREAQESNLRAILGDTLIDKLKSLVDDDSIELPQNAHYKLLAEKCKYFLAYTAISEIIGKVSYKVANFGLVKSTDENLQVSSHEEMVQAQFYYESKADGHCDKIQRWLLENRKSFPELSSCQCYKIESNLYSKASCGIFLGGARGKSREYVGVRRRR